MRLNKFVRTSAVSRECLKGSEAVICQNVDMVMFLNFAGDIGCKALPQC